MVTESSQDRLRRLDRNMADANFAFFATSDLGEIAENRDLRIWCCGLPVSDFNVAFLKLPVRDLAACLAKGEAFFGPRGLPWRVGLRREAAEGHAPELKGAGFAEVTRFPGMVLSPLPDCPPAVPGLEIREVAGAEELEQFRTTAFTGFGLPGSLGAKFITQQFSELPDLCMYVGYREGAPVCTSSILMTGDQIGVYWVATLKELRGRGLGEAITWAAVAGGRGLGGRWASLQASQLGRPVYERMGFETLTEYVFFERPTPG